MPMSRNRATRAVLCATALASALFALQATVLAAPPIVIEDPTRPAPVSISDSSLDVFFDQTDYRGLVCLALVDHGTATATRIGVDAALLDASGTVLVVRTMRIRGVFRPGVRTAYSGYGGSEATSNGNCLDVSDGVPGTSFHYSAGRGASWIDVAAIVASVTEVGYDDGTTWSATSVPHAGDQLALPTAAPFVAAVPYGLPIMTTKQSPGAPVTVVDAYPLDSRGHSMIMGHRVGFTTRALCAAIGDLAKPANDVRVALTLVDRTGNVAGVETLDLRGRFDVGKTYASMLWCEGVSGRSDGDTFLYGPTLSPIGRIIASPLLVQFQDGTSWTGPPPQTAGQPLLP
jgi:hypothetical protein